MLCVAEHCWGRHFSSRSSCTGHGNAASSTTTSHSSHTRPCRGSSYTTCCSSWSRGCSRKCVRLGVCFSGVAAELRRGGCCSPRCSPPCSPSRRSACSRCSDTGIPRFFGLLSSLDEPPCWGGLPGGHVGPGPQRFTTTLRQGGSESPTPPDQSPSDATMDQGLRKLETSATPLTNNSSSL